MNKKIILGFTTTLLFSISVIGCGNGGGGGGGTPTEPSVCFHYQRNDDNYDEWNLWIWQPNKDGKAFAFNGKDDFGAKATYPLSTWDDPESTGLGFIVRTDSWSKDPDGDRFVDFKHFTKDENQTYNIYLRTKDANIYTSPDLTITPEITSASFYSKTHITAYTTVEAKTVVLKEGGQAIDARVTIYPKRVELYLENGKEVDYTKEYELFITTVDGDELSSKVLKTQLYSDNYLTDYLYDGELGAIYTPEKTTFKVWSPFSSKITLKLYSTGTPASLNGSDVVYKEAEMTKGEKGVFSVEVSGDLEGKYYTYEVTNSSFTEQEVVDPYARSCGVNGLRGMIVDFSKTNPDNWDEVRYLPYDRKELTVYETHVADVTSSSTWTGNEADRKLFNGMYQSGTTYEENGVTVKTGFDHIKELGVNAVQLIPIFDQANNEQNMTFNWGYNPLNYNCLEGGYSTDPEDGYARIIEFKKLVQVYNKANISIIMDVVYNHVNGAKNSNFDVLFPEYYFRYDNAGALSNGSGCGNETASDHYMMRKFIVDSIKFWTDEYKLGGFRFDLMGLHDLETMKEVVSEAKKINPYVTVYGEPWTGGTSPDTYSGATKARRARFEGYGAFNDEMRDALIKGGLKGATELGWIDNEETSISAEDVNYIVNGIKGGADGVLDPDKVVNYVTCHDNYTLYDRMIATKKYSASDEDKIAKMNVLANSVVFTSQGTTFMLAGEEMLRTKQGNNNSYNASYKVNELDYSLKVKHLDMFESYKKLIALKQSLDGLHLDKDHLTDLKPAFASSNATISYHLSDTANSRDYIVIHSNGLGDDATYDLSGYTLYWSTIHGSDKVLNAQTKVDKYETIIAYK